MGPGDHRCHDGQARICCGPVVNGQRPDKRDRIIVQEKLDGSCTSVARIDDEIVALGRAGYLAQSSPYEQHQLFAAWVRERDELLRLLLAPGERLVGEWLAQAHGTRYALPHLPWVVFDLMIGIERTPWARLLDRIRGLLPMPRTVSVGPSVTIEAAMELVAADPTHHGALEPIEGAVWRVERDDAVDFLAKYVRPDKVDGCYLPAITKGEAVWNWRPFPAGLGL
jgi:RNA ligase